MACTQTSSFHCQTQFQVWKIAKIDPHPPMFLLFICLTLIRLTSNHLTFTRTPRNTSRPNLWTISAPQLDETYLRLKITHNSPHPIINHRIIALSQFLIAFITPNSLLLVILLINQLRILRARIITYRSHSYEVAPLNGQGAKQRTDLHHMMLLELKTNLNRQFKEALMDQMTEVTQAPLFRQ